MSNFVSVEIRSNQHDSYVQEAWAGGVCLNSKVVIAKRVTGDLKVRVSLVHATVVDDPAISFELKEGDLVQILCDREQEKHDARSKLARNLSKIEDLRHQIELLQRQIDQLEGENIGWEHITNQ